MNEKQQIFEIIDGFKNLTSKIKKDNDDIKLSIKNKDITIAACKKKYKKLCAEHEELKQKYVELEKYFHQQKESKQHQKQNFDKIIIRKFQQHQLKRKRRFIIDDDDDDDDVVDVIDDNIDDDDNTDYNADVDENTKEENDNDDIEIIKIKRNNKRKKQQNKNNKKNNQNKKKTKISKGIIDYINNNN